MNDILNQSKIILESLEYTTDMYLTKKKNENVTHTPLTAFICICP